MLDPKLLRQSLPEIITQLALRGFQFNLKHYQHLEAQRKQLQVKMQNLQNERNVRSKAIGVAKSQKQDVTDQLADLKTLSDNLKQVEDEFAIIQQQLDVFLGSIPNLTHASAPVGKSAADNPIVREYGQPRQFDFAIKDHETLGIALAGMDFVNAAKLAGARFVILQGKLAQLNRALAQFMLDLHTREHGYQEINVPYIANAECFFGTGQLPKFQEDLFALKGESERYLISTSEITVTNTVRDSILEANQLPLKYVCYSTCFRSEAGSYGKDLRGMIRQHQFEKVELVHIVVPGSSYTALDTLTQHAETVLQRLELPYRVVELCTGDIGFNASKTYDIEVWLPAQQCYREISSCSNTEAFQARRMKARFRDAAGNIDYVHTLNGSGLAIGRTLIAIMENYQDALGRIHIPAVLQPYMHGLQVIE